MKFFYAVIQEKESTNPTLIFSEKKKFFDDKETISKVQTFQIDDFDELDELAKEVQKDSAHTFMTIHPKFDPVYDFHLLKYWLPKDDQEKVIAAFQNGRTRYFGTQITFPANTERKKIDDFLDMVFGTGKLSTVHFEDPPALKQETVQGNQVTLDYVVATNTKVVVTGDWAVTDAEKPKEYQTLVSNFGLVKSARLSFEITQLQDSRARELIKNIAEKLSIYPRATTQDGVWELNEQEGGIIIRPTPTRRQAFGNWAASQSSFFGFLASTPLSTLEIDLRGRDISKMFEYRETLEENYPLQEGYQPVKMSFNKKS